ncbi:sugar transferase [Vibrio inusitatus NBRC 102082]|uniref:Sugar transferase n=1 Tax=Vibrio inusitatus NBRC 102082 TaxID=1219070 RepID=A0A4Y3HZA7_9VIBR|nr:sugar transferase [Vibrio inusitatus]GEA52351.1 sugar transferase [Vibrio inusitatus NBRC 102082]
MKRLFDIVISLIAIILLLPLLLGISLVVFFHLGSPFLFKQQRPGLGGKPFTMIKFRSMKDAFDQKGNQLPDSDRLTKFGMKLRSTSLDELPGLISVLKGDMSLVGPRPLLMEYLPLYNDRQAIRHNVRPGITGWAQVNGRNAISWEQKFEYDAWYVENQSFALDVKILILTVIKVLRKDDISAEGHVTVEPFKGEPHE